MIKIGFFLVMLMYRSSRSFTTSNIPKALETKHMHFQDKFIEFEPHSHTYKFRDTVMEKSVTQLVHNYFESFNTDAVVKAMMKKPSWPRPEYTHPCGRPYTEEEIANKWTEQGETAKTKGSRMHEIIESIMNQEQVENPMEMKEISQFCRFHKDVLVDQYGIEPYRTEWRIAAPNIGLAGSVDFVGQLPDNTFVLVDWKRSKNANSFFVNDFGKRAR
jgi:hypothetical protein